MRVGARVGARKLEPVVIRELMYADDLVLLAESEMQLQKTLTEWNHLLLENGLNIIANIMETMVISKEVK